MQQAGTLWLNLCGLLQSQQFNACVFFKRIMCFLHPEWQIRLKQVHSKNRNCEDVQSHQLNVYAQYKHILTLHDLELKATLNGLTYFTEGSLLFSCIWSVSYGLSQNPWAVAHGGMFEMFVCIL